MKPFGLHKKVWQNFDVNSQAITKYLQNIYNEDELQKEGNSNVKNNMNLL